MKTVYPFRTGPTVDQFAILLRSCNWLVCVAVVAAMLGNGILTAQDETSASEHPLQNDPTGINWAFSLEEAIERAKAESKIVLLKPVPFRSVAGSDKLSPSSEAQRAYSLVDERVVNLLNRRFVPYYFDMDPRGSEYDQVASELSLELHPEMRYVSSVPTPPMLLVSPDKKMLGYISNFLSSDEFLTKLVEILEENPPLNQLLKEEKKIEDLVERARVLYQLRRLDEAVEQLEGQQSSESYYLRVVMAREQERWSDMKAAIPLVTDSRRQQDVAVENVLRYWSIRNYEGIKAKLVGLHAGMSRYQEAAYYLGLAWYHTGEKTKAIEIWQAAVEADRETAWALRLDWTQGLATVGPDRYLSPMDKIPSMLNRKYLTPNGNPDIKKQR